MTVRFSSVLNALAPLVGARARVATHPALRVLVVDDEEPVRRFVGRVLAEAGCTVTTAADGDEAVAIGGTGAAIDVLVTDLMMPHMNGDEVARRLRRQSPDIAVLYLTAFSDRLFAERMTLWEREAFLDKPGSIRAVLEAVSLLAYGRLDGMQRNPGLDVPAAQSR
ncbi:MAG TPA: response regulator [Vicinamibacterales bacterium]|nr:response regulator [Vicinamibacterales bacterium]